MTEEEARKIIKEDPQGNIVKRLEALSVAEQILGKCSMERIWKWVDGKDVNDES